MPKPYKARNKRIINRANNGRFRKTNLSDLGISESEIATGYSVCANCGYGKEEDWTPIMLSAPCPKCNSSEKAKPKLKKEITPEIQQKYQEYKKLTEVRFIDPFKINEINSIRIDLYNFFGTENFHIYFD